MSGSERKIRSIKREKLPQAKPDFLRLAELALVVIGVTISAVAAYFSWQAVQYTAEQARYAREALDASDKTTAFRGYIAAWNGVCKAAAHPSLQVGTVMLWQGRYNLLASNIGFDVATFKREEHNQRVAAAEDDLKAAYVDLQILLSANEVRKLDKIMLWVAYFHFLWKEEMELNDFRDHLIRASGLCHYLRDQQIAWFKDRSTEIVEIRPSQIYIEWFAEPQQDRHPNSAKD